MLEERQKNQTKNKSAMKLHLTSFPGDPGRPGGPGAPAEPGLPLSPLGPTGPIMGCASLELYAPPPGGPGLPLSPGGPLWPGVPASPWDTETNKGYARLFTPLFNIHYVDVHDGCSITVLSFYFTKSNVIRTVTNSIASKYAELCDLITMEPLILFYFSFTNTLQT